MSEVDERWSSRDRLLCGEASLVEFVERLRDEVSHLRGASVGTADDSGCPAHQRHGCDRTPS
jgi:hypothetical protein